jgi:hypothetical protein
MPPPPPEGGVNLLATPLDPPDFLYGHAAVFNSILHTVRLDDHTLTLNDYTAKCYSVKKIWFIASLTNFSSFIEEKCNHVYIVFKCNDIIVFVRATHIVWLSDQHLYKYPRKLYGKKNLHMF